MLNANGVLNAGGAIVDHAIGVLNVGGAFVDHAIGALNAGGASASRYQMSNGRP